jgi:hypothetical protein
MKKIVIAIVVIGLTTLLADFSFGDMFKEANKTVIDKNSSVKAKRDNNATTVTVDTNNSKIEVSDEMNNTTKSL